MSIEVDGVYYWVWCRSESGKPIIAEQTDHGWYLTGSEKLFTIKEIEIIKGPITPYN